MDRWRLGPMVHSHTTLRSWCQSRARKCWRNTNLTNDSLQPFGDYDSFTSNRNKTLLRARNDETELLGVNGPYRVIYIICVSTDLYWAVYSVRLCLWVFELACHGTSVWTGVLPWDRRYRYRYREDYRLCPQSLDPPCCCCPSQTPRNIAICKQSCRHGNEA